MITVIIPSKGRLSLNKSLLSLILQSNKNWNCIVSFDGLPETDQNIKDARIKYIHLPQKVGDGNNGGGAVRNKAIDSASTDWICFLDDDDSFDHQYMDCFYKELEENPEMDVCIFKMQYTNGNVLPPQGCKQLIMGQVGISFAVRLKFLNEHNIRFINSKVEDYNLLKDLESSGAKIYFSEYIVYNVGFSSI